MQALLRFCMTLAAVLAPGLASADAQWSNIPVAETGRLADDDLERHAADANYLDGLTVSETKFSEAGFNWHLIRFVNVAKPIGPLWAIPHDDENAAFEAAIAAVKTHGGVAIMVNSGPGSSRKQTGNGTCGGRQAIITSCDPNRNFSAATPLFTKAHTEQLHPGQPIIALHTNTPGYGRGKGDITILDAVYAAKGKLRPRRNGYFGQNGPPSLKDYDSYAIIPFRSPMIGMNDFKCRDSLVNQGVHVWHERVDQTDGSFSNYVALSMPGTPYVNMESRREIDLAVAAERHKLMVAAYLNGCKASGD
jgi:hypothetical protein